jgi:hypothetical protein
VNFGSFDLTAAFVGYGAKVEHFRTHTGALPV